MSKKTTRADIFNTKGVTIVKLFPQEDYYVQKTYLLKLTDLRDFDENDYQTKTASFADKNCANNNL